MSIYLYIYIYIYICYDALASTPSFSWGTVNYYFSITFSVCLTLCLFSQFNTSIFLSCHSLCFSLFLSLSLSIYIYICQSIYLSIYIYIYIYICNDSLANTSSFSWGTVNHYFSITFSVYLSTMSRYQHGYPWTSLATPSYSPLLPVGLQKYIPNQHKAAVCRFELVVLSLLVHIKGPQEYITYELVPTSPIVSRMSGLSNLDNFRDGSLVAVQLLVCGGLPPGLVQYCLQYSCVVAVKLFLHMFS